jgi:hypothetical protein
VPEVDVLDFHDQALVGSLVGARDEAHVADADTPVEGRAPVKAKPKRAARRPQGGL